MRKTALLLLALLAGSVSARTRQEIDAQYTREIQQATSSVQRGQAIQSWGMATKAAGAPAEELRAGWISRVKELMRSDFHEAFLVVLESDFLPGDPKTRFGLFPEHEASLRKLALYKVESYNADPPLPYPADLPLPGHAWGDLSRGAASPTPPPGPAAWQPSWKPGQFFSDENGQVSSVLLKVDPAKKKYLLLVRTWYPKAEPYYLTAEEWGHYILKEVWFDEKAMTRARPMVEKFRACNQCGGESCQYVEGGRARGGHWEQVSSTLQVYTPRRIPISYTKVVCCPGCGGTGWIQR